MTRKWKSQLTVRCSSEYLVLVGSVPLPKNAADMSGSDFVLPHVELRAKAMENPEV